MSNFFTCLDPLPASAVRFTDMEAYLIGKSVDYDPSKEVFRNMLRLVAYDIANARRLRKVANACKDYGIRIEYSVFECDLSEKIFATFWERLQKLIDPKEDRLIAYRICAGCVLDIRSVGVVSRPGKVLLYII